MVTVASPGSTEPVSRGWPLVSWTGRQGRLRWHRPALTGVGTDRVQGRWAVASVVRIPDGLAVQGHYPTGHQAVWGLYPVRKPRLHSSGSRRYKDLSKGIVGGMPCGRCSHCSNQSRWSTSPPSVGAAADGSVSGRGWT